MGLDQYLSADLYISRKDYFQKVGEYDFADNPAFQAVLEAANATSYVDEEHAGLKVQIPIGYWRKANAIHKWFVDTLADGVDECQEIYVPREQLIGLLDRCRMVQADHSKAEYLLPSTDGFFFGGTDYDDYYHWWNDKTVEILERVLATVPEDCSIVYQASW